MNGESIDTLGWVVSFNPVVNNRTEILILGSMPGQESLQKQQYYANDRNHFWRIMESALYLEPGLTYQGKMHFLLDHGIGLWDVLAGCRRQGSLDANIRDGVVNDFAVFFSQYPAIHSVLFNGSAAYDIFQKKVGFRQFQPIRFEKMPSTSPANTLRYDIKLKKWQAGLNGAITVK